MKSQSAKTYLKPEDVPSAKAKNTLAFLNSVTAVEEIADAIEIPGERDIGIRLAKRILDRRLMLGGFKDIKQIAAIPQIGPDRFARIIEALGTKTNVSIPHLVEGRITSTGKIDFGKAKLAVHAFVGGVEVARSKVNAQGKYKITFEHKKPSPATELRVLPAAFSHRAAKMLTLSKTISSSRYALKKGYRAQYDLLIPPEYLVIWGTVTKTYHMQGAVYATVFSGSPPVPISIEPLPAAKIEFYEVDAPLFWIIGTEPELAEVCLGYTYTGPDGSYDFEFDFSYKNNPGAWSWLLTDKVPDIRARVSQFMDGLWQQVYEGPVDWNIVEDFHRDYFVPVEDILPVPDEGVKPDEGFRFVSVGLLPIDSTCIH